MHVHELLQRISQGTEKAYLEKCRDQRELFMEGKPVDPGIVPKVVYNSWVRSQRYGVDPFEKPCHHPIDKSKSKELSRFIECLERYNFFIKQALELIDYQGFTFTFSAKESLTKHIYDDLGSPFANLIGECSERTVGTNATAIALAENVPVALVSSLSYQYWPSENGVNTAAPIHNHQGEVMGGIHIGLKDIKRTQDAFWLVTYLAQVFDRLYLPMTQKHEKKIKDIIDLLPQGVAYINNKKSIHYNEKFQTLVNLSKGKNSLKKVSEFFSQEDWTSIFACQEIKADGKTLIINSNSLDYEDFETSKIFIVEEKQSLTQRLQENSQGSKTTVGLYSFDDIVGNNAELNEAKSIGLNVAGTSVPVLIFGENGTGKEMFAQAIHAASPRREKPFIAINCGAIPAELVESELFGYEEGSFTGALKGGKIGKIEAASGGTLFLDEIESMPVQDQIKLLRVISTGKVQKVGSTKEIPVDIRLISATKKDLLEESDKGLFREDLYFRISTFIIELPALRQRREDILLLAKEFISKFSRKYGLEQTVEMAQEFVEALENYSWRGNVRELEHSIERAIILMGAGLTLKVDYLSKRIQESYQNYQVKGLVEDVLAKGLKKQEQGLLYTAEAMIIDHVLKSVGGNVTAAAEKLGVTRKTIYNKLQEHPDLRVVK